MRSCKLFLAIVSITLLVSSVAPRRGKKAPGGGKKTGKKPNKKPKPAPTPTSTSKPKPTGNGLEAGTGNWEDVLALKMYMQLKDLLDKNENSSQSSLIVHNVDIAEKCCFIIKGALSKNSNPSKTFLLSNAFAPACSGGGCAYLMYEDLEINVSRQSKAYCLEENGDFCQKTGVDNWTKPEITTLSLSNNSRIKNIASDKGRCPEECRDFEVCTIKSASTRPHRSGFFCNICHYFFQCSEGSLLHGCDCDAPGWDGVRCRQWRGHGSVQGCCFVLQPTCSVFHNVNFDCPPKC